MTTAGSVARRRKATLNAFLGTALSLVVAFACSDDDSPTPKSSGGGSSGSRAAGEGGEAGTNGGDASGGTNSRGGNGGAGGTRTSGGNGTTGGNGASGSAGKSGEGGRGDGGQEPMGGAAGELAGAGGAGDREATPDEICRAYCPPGAYHIMDIVRYYCGEPWSTTTDSGEGGAGGSGGYDPEVCYQYCLGMEEVNVAPVCRDEAMLYMTCRLDFGNWVCLEGGGGHPLLCSPMFDMLSYCATANP